MITRQVASVESVLEALAAVHAGADASEVASSLIAAKGGVRLLKSILAASVPLLSEIEIEESKIESAIGCGSPRGW